MGDRLPTLATIDVGIDGYFSLREQKDIIKGLVKWQDATHGLIALHIIDMKLKNLITHKKYSSSWYAINIVKGLSTDKIIIEAQKTCEYTVCGWAINDDKAHVALLMVDTLSSKRDLVKLVMHEVGHLLGLPHSGVPKTVMHKYINQNTGHVTGHDLEALINRWRHYFGLPTVHKHKGASSTSKGE